MPKISVDIMTILVVDDEPMVQFLLSSLLQDEGHVVLIASNGCEALQLLEQGPVDLLITDTHMPLLSGADLVRIVHQRYPALPIVVMDSYPDAFVEDATAEGVFTTLVKPFDLSEVRQVLQALDEMRCAA
ncbi:Sensor histidine kinase TmoS [bacterium HR15]|nr:Sensor histidine kinase TmoS [bacterium HR15]